jgi:hypothetical protein
VYHLAECWQTEMAKEDKLMNVVIIASNKSSAEFPAYLRVGK